MLAGGRKVLGLSQARRRPGALLQAGIPMRLDAARLARLMGRGAAFARALAEAAAGLDEVAPGASAADVVAAVDAAVAARAGARFRADDLTEAERAAIAGVPTAPRGGVRPNDSEDPPG